MRTNFHASIKWTLEGEVEKWISQTGLILTRSRDIIIAVRVAASQKCDDKTKRKRTGKPRCHILQVRNVPTL